MKVLFTLGIGVVVGWASAWFDPDGQLALELHQEKVNESMYLADLTQKVEEVETSGFFSFVWP
ncbi:hypothetical protein [Rufibacter hautae]|uniref:Uncharacterized protein n=1 Tax=Rufibacter hautae TaxID=2595005 RepID=A0A5B6TDX5_9BACT|nr:hypothetical protein [Rufibacter hautae]KAA3438348.1 hypothetical protein FOA19_13960 [Rufibacter hautae]